MGIGKGHALACQFVDMRSLDLAILGVEALYISVAQVITHYQNNIGAVVTPANSKQKYGRKDCEQRYRFARFHGNIVLGKETKFDLIDHWFRLIFGYIR